MASSKNNRICVMVSITHIHTSAGWFELDHCQPLLSSSPFFYTVSSIFMFRFSPDSVSSQAREETAYEIERDGEEYNLIGSTEHVEGRLEEIRRNGFAYCKYICEDFTPI